VYLGLAQPAATHIDEINRRRPQRQGDESEDPIAGARKAFLCAACHGMTGKSQIPDIPHLAGQHSAYLATQIKEFRRAAHGTAKPEFGRQRHDDVMTGQTARLSADDIENLAAYFAAQPCRTRGAAVGGPMPQVAERCVSCHGDGGRSVTPTVPHLAGQQERYLDNQLRAFQDLSSGNRRYRKHKTMSRQVGPLSDESIRTLARYFAGQPCR